MTEHQLIRVRVPEGRVVPNLDTGAGNITSAPEGELVRRTRFVERRLADGDLVPLVWVREKGSTSSPTPAVANEDTHELLAAGELELVEEHDAAPAAEGDV